MKKRLAPCDLSPEARALFAQLTHEFDFVGADLLLVEELARTLDRLREAQAHIRKHGSVFQDRWGQMKPNPSILQERDCRSHLIKIRRALGLHLELVSPGRK